MHAPRLFVTAIMAALVSQLVPSVNAQDDPYRPPAVAAEGVPVVPAELIDRLRQYQEVRTANFRGWSPDGKGVLIETRFGNTNQLHRVYEPGGRREQVTFFTEPANGRFVPKSPQTLLIEMGTGGNEQYQVYRHDLLSGRTHLLTDGESRNMLGPVAEDGAFCLINSNRRNGRDMDFFRLQLDGTTTSLMEVENEFWVPLDLSTDAARALLLQYVSINESYPALFDVTAHERSPLPSPEGASGKVAFGDLKFLKDGQSVLLSTDARGEFLELARLDLKTSKYTFLSEDIPWDVEAIEVDPHLGQAAVTINENGASALYLFSNGKPERLEVPLGMIEAMEFSPDGGQLGFTLSRPDAPADAFSLHLASGKLMQWTFSEVGGLDTSTFIRPSLIEYPSFDDRKIPAYVFRPKGASAQRPAPVLINIHGGPEGQYRPYFSGLDQFFLNDMGIAVIRPNVRGSAGYGKTYLQLDNAEKREDSVRDIGALLDWIATQPDLDASRVAVIGGSYGGYMVLGSLTNYSDRLKAGIDIVGIASFKTFLENTSEYRRDLRRAEYGDERDTAMQEVFARIDPLHNAERINTALMVVHGVNDPRVPFSEAEQIAPKVRQNNQPVWTVYADNEGHGFARKENRDYMNAAIALFLQEHVLKP